MKINFHISGRLGNQLFQWAFLHELVEQGFEIKLFVDKYHNSNLNVDIDRLLHHCGHLHKVKVRNDLGTFLRFREKLFVLGGPFLYLVKILPIHIESIPKKGKWKIFPQIVDGYFIDKLWVQKHHSILLDELNSTLNEIPTDKDLDDLIKNGPSSRTHVRRGDLNSFKSTFGLLSANYYKSLIQLNETLLVLTDSKNEAQHLLRNLENVNILDPVKYDVWSALLILSRSRKFIMSNSTLGWWAGFLAQNISNAEVFMPKPFYTKMSKFDDLLDLDGFTQFESSFE